MIAVVLIGLLFAGAVVLNAVRQPWLGLTLSESEAGAIIAVRTTGPSAAIPAGTAIAAIGNGGTRMALRSGDLLIEPDGNLARYTDYDAFLARQDALMRIKQAPQVALTAQDGRTWTVTPDAHRPITSLPAEFWTQLFVGVVAWLIAGAIWVFRRTERSARYLLLNGASTLTFAPFASVYGTRELAIAETPFRFFSDMNFFGGSVFIASMVAIMLYYPRKIAPAWVGRAVIALFIGWFAAQQVGLFDSMVFARRFLVFVGLITTFAVGAAQWRGTRVDPVTRAALQWFLLSWLIAVWAFALLIFVPQIFGIDTSALQAWAFLLFLPVYIGLAFGIVRYRLFDLGEWWARAMTWMASIVFLVLLDMLFLLGLQMSPELSVSLALLLCGLLWLPLRGALWGRFAVRNRGEPRGRFQQLADAAFQEGSAGRAQAWSTLLESVYQPLEAKPIDLRIDAVEIAEDGLVLLVPPAGDAPALRLAHPQRGRQLFNRADVDLASELAEMFDHLVHNRAAFDAGAATERKRIAQDVHDHVGASLLDALHSPQSDRKDRLIRETLADLRGIITGATQPEQPIGEALIQLRHETAERLEAKNIRLDWRTPASELIMEAARLHTIHSIIREATSNAIKHSGCSTLRISIVDQPDAVTITIEDDGCGFDPHAQTGGAGLANISERAIRAGGRHSWLPASGQFTSRMQVNIPLGATA
jgi:signal transduction histidine kinase